MTRHFDPDAIPVPRMPRRWFRAIAAFQKPDRGIRRQFQSFTSLISAKRETIPIQAFNRFIADPGRPGNGFEERRYLPPILDDRGHVARYAQRLHLADALIALHAIAKAFDGSGAG